MKSFATCGVPDAKADLSSCSIINGISIAVEAISELTELQKKQSDLNSGFKCFGKYNNDEKQSGSKENLSGFVDDKEKTDLRSAKFAVSIYSFKKYGFLNKNQITAIIFYVITYTSGPRKQVTNKHVCFLFRVG